MTPRLLVTAGPTAEDIDAVRFITNRSTGRMGMAVAAASHARGWPTTLILGPVAATPPTGVEVVRIRSAADLCVATLSALAEHDLLVMTAAVADYTPAEPFDGKIKKADGDLFLRLKRTEDVLARVAANPRRRSMVVIGFSLDKQFNEAEGRRKLAAKDLDAIVVNTTATFGSERIAEARILWRDGRGEDIGTQDKTQLAERLLDGAAEAWRAHL